MTIMYLVNCIPTPLLQNHTPFKVLFGHPPAYQHLRVFECLTFATTLTQGRKKFDPRSHPSIFVEYPFGIKGTYNIFAFQWQNYQQKNQFHC